MSFWVMRGFSRERAVLAFDEFDAAVEACRDDVPVVEEGVLLEADVDEGRLEAVFEVADLALEDAAHQPLVLGPLDGELFEAALLRERRRGFRAIRR